MWCQKPVPCSSAKETLFYRLEIHSSTLSVDATRWFLFIYETAIYFSLSSYPPYTCAYLIFKRPPTETLSFQNIDVDVFKKLPKSCAVELLLIFVCKFLFLLLVVSFDCNFTCKSSSLCTKSFFVKIFVRCHRSLFNNN